MDAYFQRNLHIMEIITRKLIKSGITLSPITIGRHIEPFQSNLLRCVDGFPRFVGMTVGKKTSGNDTARMSTNDQKNKERKREKLI